jgi:hypothetical protein
MIFLEIPTNQHIFVQRKYMNYKEFNEKYKDYIPDGWYGLGFDIPEVTDYLDVTMEDLITIPGFELHQIKLKFNMARFYFDTKWKDKGLEAALMIKIESKINELVKQHDAVGKDEMFN